MSHDHSDRGQVHQGCPACEALQQQFPSVAPEQLHDYRREAMTVHPSNTYFTFTPGSLNVSMPHSANPFSAPPAHAAHDALKAHLASEDHRIILVGNTKSNYQAMLELHATAHQGGLGHVDSPDHFVRPAEKTPTFRPKVSDPKVHKDARAAQREAAAKALADNEARTWHKQRHETLQEFLDRMFDALKAKGYKPMTEPTRVEESSTLQGLQVFIDVKQPTAVATVTLAQRDGSLFPEVGTGIALCHPSDTWQTNLGVQLAVARALVDFGEQLEEDLMALISRRGGQ